MRSPPFFSVEYYQISFYTQHYYSVPSPLKLVMMMRPWRRCFYAQDYCVYLSVCGSRPHHHHGDNIRGTSRSAVWWEGGGRWMSHGLILKSGNSPCTIVQIITHLSRTTTHFKHTSASSSSMSAQLPHHFNNTPTILLYNTPTSRVPPSH